MNVYISKSNLSNPDDLFAVRKFLEEQQIQTAEYSGGQYSSAPIKECDILVHITYPQEAIVNKENLYVLTGKGGYTEIKVAMDHGKHVLLYFKGIFHKVNLIKVNNSDDYKREYGLIEVTDVVNIKDMLKDADISTPKVDFDSVDEMFGI
jgi:hypothetical protein